MQNQTYFDAVEVLDAELAGLGALLQTLDGERAWLTPTNLVPEGEGLPPWRVIDLIAHIDISIGLTHQLLDSLQDGQPGRDRASFFIANRSEVAPVVYDYARATARDHTPETLLPRVLNTLETSLKRIRESQPEFVGSGYFALMSLEEWVPTRVVEAVVHGLDITDALGMEPIATRGGLEMTAGILDELLARKAVAGRPRDLGEDLDWVRAGSGRAPHSDPRLPLIV
ncbi:maleylpyruvate isomerase N-terminal domain-containing protein [Pseudonocardia sp. RS010]|uniref:maleylpyruvate isomerase N-terminal domain-containing protein n=1 Tax=Pseudonocardia sp. RS010 TaxID=3385979 RepID=UPI00399FBE7A